MHDALDAGPPGRMKAIVCPKYGSPDVLELDEVDVPALPDDRVLVRVMAAAVNPVDRYGMRGPMIARVMGNGLRRPKYPIVGADLSGKVEAVGQNVTKIKVGDEVFGTAPGSFAEYAAAREDRLALKPGKVTFEEAAGLPIAGITALQSLRDWGQVRPGQKVLINGASGGVGTFAVQIAKALGAEVTAVCSTGNVALVRSLGADRVIDYTREDFAEDGALYDLVLENAGNRSLSDCRRVLTPNGILVLNAAPRGRSLMLSFLVRLVKGAFLSRFTSKKVVFHIAKINQADLEILKGLIEEGKLRPVVDRSYPLIDAADAMRYLETGHARAKVVVSV